MIFENVEYAAIFGDMNAILYTPEFRWFGVDESGGWLTMAVDVKASRPEFCPQDIGGGVDPKQAKPLSLCIYNTTQ